MVIELQKPSIIQSQKLNMTYFMKRSITIMQLTNLELKEFLYSEVEKNPILEIKINPEIFVNTVKEPFSIYSCKYRPSLFEYLSQQVKEYFQDKTDLFLAENIIGNLDNKGYFTLDIDTFTKDLNIEKNKILDILNIIKTFDPKGIAAKNLQERILLQINNKNSLEYKIIKDYFPLILKNKLGQITKKLKNHDLNIQSLLEKTLRNINFDPTTTFSSNQPVDIYPDIIINKKGKNWFIEIEENLPDFNIKKSYVSILEKTKQGSSKKYVFDAKILMKNIFVRRKTLQNICSYIIQKQKSYILGNSSLNPLTIKETAASLNLHTSTICRAIMNKYIQCPLGLLPIKTFFSHSYKEKQTLKLFESQLQEILIDENKKKPLSDKELAKRLKLKGFNLHRRTICKYRKRLNIGTSHQRKKSF